MQSPQEGVRGTALSFTVALYGQTYREQQHAGEVHNLPAQWSRQRFDSMLCGPQVAEDSAHSGVRRVPHCCFRATFLAQPFQIVRMMDQLAQGVAMRNKKLYDCVHHFVRCPWPAQDPARLVRAIVQSEAAVGQEGLAAAHGAVGVGAGRALVGCRANRDGLRCVAHVLEQCLVKLGLDLAARRRATEDSASAAEDRLGGVANVQGCLPCSASLAQEA